MAGINSKEVTSLNGIQPGDHIKYKRWGGVYSHHAIVVSVRIRRYVIIQFDPTVTRKACKFGDQPLQRLDYPPNTRFTKEETVAVAYHFLNHGYGQYNLLNNNCEHFATTCATGHPFSIQAMLGAQVAGFIGIPLPIAQSDFKQVVFVKKRHGRYEVTVKRN